MILSLYDLQYQAVHKFAVAAAAAVTAVLLLGPLLLLLLLLPPQLLLLLWPWKTLENPGETWRTLGSIAPGIL